MTIFTVASALIEGTIKNMLLLFHLASSFFLPFLRSPCFSTQADAQCCWNGQASAGHLFSLTVLSSWCRISKRNFSPEVVKHFTLLVTSGWKYKQKIFITNLRQIHWLELVTLGNIKLISCLSIGNARYFYCQQNLFFWLTDIWQAKKLKEK